MTFQFHLHNGETENSMKKESMISSMAQWGKEGPKKKNHWSKNYMINQNELQIAKPAQTAEPTASSSTSSVRCVGGRIVRPSQREEESPSPSTACNSSMVLITTPGGVQLGSIAQPPCFGCPPGVAQAPSIPLPPLPPSALVDAALTAETYPREWRLPSPRPHQELRL